MFRRKNGGLELRALHPARERGGSEKSRGPRLVTTKDGEDPDLFLALSLMIPAPRLKANNPATNEQPFKTVHT